MSSPPAFSRCGATRYRVGSFCQGRCGATRDPTWPFCEHNASVPPCPAPLALVNYNRSGLSPLGSSALLGSTKITDLLPLTGVPDELPRPSNSGYASSTRASCLASLRAVPLASRASCASFERFPRLFFFGPVVRPFLKQCGASRNCFVARFYPQPLVMRG